MEKISTLHFEWHYPKSKVLYFIPNFNDIWFKSPDDKMFALVLSIVCFPNRRHVIPWIIENDNTIKKTRVHISSTIKKHVSSGLSYFILFPGWFLIWPPGKISFADDSYWLYHFQYTFVHISSIGLFIQLCSFSFLYNLGKRPVIAISYKNMF